MNHPSKKTLSVIAAAAVAVAVIFFLAGFAAGKHRSSKSQIAGFGPAGGMMRGPGMTGAANGGMRGRAGNGTAGTVLSSDATSITLSTQGGGSKTVLISPSTVVLKSAPGTRDDLSNGSNIIVTGSPNADGSISAATVSIRPAQDKPEAPQNP